MGLFPHFLGDGRAWSPKNIYQGLPQAPLGLASVGHSRAQAGSQRPCMRQQLVVIFTINGTEIINFFLALHSRVSWTSPTPWNLCDDKCHGKGDHSPQPLGTFCLCLLYCEIMVVMLGDYACYVTMLMLVMLRWLCLLCYDDYACYVTMLMLVMVQWLWLLCCEIMLVMLRLMLSYYSSWYCLFAGEHTKNIVFFHVCLFSSYYRYNTLYSISSFWNKNYSRPIAKFVWVRVFILNCHKWPWPVSTLWKIGQHSRQVLIFQTRNLN